jgi:glyoxylase-like metal-dependent hydrolase (beta-lactamase superfamily II)
MYRKVVLALSLATAVGAAALAQDSGQLHREPLAVSPLGKGAYLVTGGISNAGFVIGDKGVIAIDAQMFVEDAKREQAEIAKITKLPIHAVILTHSDIDHVNGLPGWPRAIQIIAQENTKPEIQVAIENTDPRQMTSPPELKDYLPTHSIRRSETMVIDGVRVVLTHLAAAHTDSDLVIFLPAQRVVFTGDLLTLGDPNLPNGGPYPVIHLIKHGSSLGWITVMKAVLALDADTFVGGHGPAPVTRVQVEAAVAATEERRAAVKRLFDQGRSLVEIKTALHDPSRTGPMAFVPTFVESTYQELLQE